MNNAALVNRMLAALLALALVLAGLLAATELVLAALGRPHWLVAWEGWAPGLRQQRWQDLVVRAVLAAAAVVGLLLLWPALRRGKPRTVVIPGDSQDVSFVMQRRALEKTLAARVARVSGVSGASASASRRTVSVTARTQLRNEGSLSGDAQAAVEERLDELGLSGRLRPRTRVKRKNT